MPHLEPLSPCSALQVALKLLVNFAHAWTLLYAPGDYPLQSVSLFLVHKTLMDWRRDADFIAHNLACWMTLLNCARRNIPSGCWCCHLLTNDSFDVYEAVFPVRSEKIPIHFNICGFITFFYSSPVLLDILHLCILKPMITTRYFNEDDAYKQ